VKEVALYDAKNGLSALIQEVEETGAEIVITRHGRPAAKLSPIEAPRRKAQAEAVAALRAIRQEAAQRYPNAQVVPWETLKEWARDEDDDGR
jgi:prevent-host-death family protein